MIDQVFLGKRPIDHWVKDREALLRDPRGELGANPVSIPGVSIRGLMVSCAAMLALTWGISLAEGEIFVEAIVLTLFLGGPLMAFAVVVSRGQELVLSPRGVELRTAWARTILPWDLFVVRGELEAKSAALVMPINESAAGRIEIHRSGKLWKRGAEETGLIKGGKLRLGVPYQVASSDLGELLLELGPRLEGATVPADEGSDAQPIPALDGGELTRQEGSGFSLRLPRFAVDGEDQGPAHDALFRLHPKLVRLLERTEAGRRGALMLPRLPCPRAMGCFSGGASHTAGASRRPMGAVGRALSRRVHARPERAGGGWVRCFRLIPPGARASAAARAGSPGPCRGRSAP